MKFQKEQIYFLPLGGSGEIGMNLNLYHYHGKWIMVDLGIGFRKSLGIDIMVPDITFINEIKNDLLGLFITHAHEDHIGAIPYLWSEIRCPIYATPFASYLIREKLKSASLLNEATINEINVKKSINVGAFTIDYIAMTHSIPESYLLKIKTDLGNIIHTGDWKIDKNPVVGHKNDIPSLEALGQENNIALVCDSTNIFEEGSAGSELEVQECLESIISVQKQKVIVTAFASNLARMISCIKIAKNCDRKVVLAGGSLWKIAKAAEKCGYINSIKELLSDESINDYPDDKLLILCTGSQGENNATMAKVARKRHPNIHLKKGDTIIFSSRTIPGNEESVQEIYDQLFAQEVNIINDNDDLTHVSGHSNRDEFKTMYDWIRPKSIIPVHGEHAHLREHAAFALDCGIEQSLEANNGTVMQIASTGILKNVGKVHSGKILIDGLTMVTENCKNVNTRKILSTDGSIFISIDFVSGNLRTENRITVSLLGIPIFGQEDQFIIDLKLSLVEFLNSLSKANSKNSEYIINNIIKNTKRFIRSTVGKRPLVECHLINEK